MNTEAKELTFAVGLAREAGKIMRENFKLGMTKEWKEDSSPLTKTDLAINQLVLEAVAREYPEHSFIGEEAGGKVTDLDGNEQRYDGSINGLIVSNGLVHEELVDALK